MPARRGRADGVRVALQAVRWQWSAAPAACAGLVAATVVSGLSAPAVAWVLRTILDSLGDASTGRLVGLSVALVVAQAVVTTSLHLSAYLMTVAGQRLGVALHDRLFARVADLRGLRRFEDPRFLDELHQANEGIDRAPQIFTFLQDAARVAVAATAFLVPLIALWPPMGLLLAAALVPAVLAQVHQARRRAALSRLVAATYRRQFLYRALLTDPSAAKEMRLFGFARLMQGRMVAALREASGAEVAIERRAAGVQAAVGLLGAAVTGIGVVVVVRGAADGRFSVGDVAFFLAAVAGLESTIAGLINAGGHVGQHVHLFSRLLAVLDTPDDLDDGEQALAPLREAVVLDDVWFRYEDGPWVLRGVSLTIPAGATVGVVGLNGAGKSTLVKLLCRFYDPQRGAIRWDGVDQRDVAIDALRRRIGVTFQDFMSYDLSAAENVGLGDPERREDRERVRAGARLAGIDETLEALPKGYDTMLSRTFLDAGDGTRGAMLSGGQWQRVAIARSLMRADADLLVLDEPNSGLDAQAEHRLHTAIGEQTAGRTRLLVSHRLAALRGADVIVVLADGVIAEQGTHDELMVAGGEYARLFRLQAKDYQDERVLEAAG